MSCPRCDDGFIVRCVDDVCRGIGECQMGNLSCDGIVTCPVCNGDPDALDNDEDFAEAE